MPSPEQSPLGASWPSPADAIRVNPNEIPQIPTQVLLRQQISQQVIQLTPAPSPALQTQPGPTEMPPGRVGGHSTHTDTSAATPAQTSLLVTKKDISIHSSKDSFNSSATAENYSLSEKNLLDFFIFLTSDRRSFINCRVLYGTTKSYGAPCIHHNKSLI